MQPTWTPHEKHGQLTAKSDLPDTVFAFPKQRKEPLTDAKHVRNAVARFDQVIDVSDDDRALAFANIEKAAKYYDVDLSETSWRELGVHPQRAARRPPPRALRPSASAENCKEAGARGAATRKRGRATGAGWQTRTNAALSREQGKLIAAIVGAPSPRLRWPMPSRGFQPGLSLGRLRRGAAARRSFLATAPARDINILICIIILRPPQARRLLSSCRKRRLRPWNRSPRAQK